MDTAGRIKILRLLNGYTQEAIAALLGTSRPSIVVWESGKHPPSSEYVIRLADLVGVEPGYISYGSPRVSCCAWIPTPPDRAQNLSPYLRDIASLFPEFLDENGLDAARFSKLGDGGTMFLLGREREFSCLMLVRESLSASFIKFSQVRNVIEMGSFDRVTVESFGEDELTFIAKHAADFSVNLDGIWKALVKARPGGRAKEDALNILFTAFSIVMQQYKITAEDQLKLSNFFTEKYRALPPLHKLSAGNLQGEVRKFLESLGCQRCK
jgi:transcriptional regulator with XRE-family HTH domain